MKKGEFSGFRKRISFINRRCSAVNGSTVVIFVLMETQFNVLSNDTDIAKKYEFLIQNRKKNLKIGFFDNFARFGRNTRRLFSALQVSTINDKIHVLQKNLKNPPKILWVSIFFRFLKTNFSGSNFCFIFTDLTSKNSTHFSLSDDTVLFQKNEFFIWFFSKIETTQFFEKNLFTPKFTVRKSW